MEGRDNAPAIRNIIEFDLDENERIGFLRKGTEQNELVCIRESGEVIQETPLRVPGVPKLKSSFCLAWVEGNRWIATVSLHGQEKNSLAWWWDAPSGRLEPVAEFKAPRIRSISSSRDGGFIVLATEDYQYSMTDQLIAFDSNGKLRWKIEQDYNSDDSALFSPDDICVARNGTIAVVDNIQNSIQTFDQNGKFLRKFDLVKTWKREPNYPTEISNNPGGGFLVKDFNGKPPFVEMTSAGSIIREFAPKHKDGRPVDAILGIKISDAGNYWACDGESFLRLDPQGIVGTVLGKAPTMEELGIIAGIEVDNAGQVYAIDKRTGAIHLFGMEGKRLRVYKPNRDDFAQSLSVGHMTVSPTGRVYLAKGESGYIEFAPTGERIGQRKFALDGAKEIWHFLPGGNELLVEAFREVCLLTDDGQVRSRIQKRPGGNWLQMVIDAKVASDGRFLVVSDAVSNETWHANIYSSAGEPKETCTFEEGFHYWNIAFSRRGIITAKQNEIHVLTSEGKPLLRFKPKETEAINCQMFSPFDGKELWLVSHDQKSVWKYRLP